MRLSTSVSKSSSYDRLHPEIQRWIREQGWAGLREIQDRAIGAILSSDADIVIMAGTASGKTEAAFLPLLTRAAADAAGGLRVLYVSPLKALINDQHRRLELLCERLEIPLTRWHGDAPQGPKTRLLRHPAGVALITPESIEALLIRRPAEARQLFAGVQAIVIDELHAFLQGPRGLHLASLLRRLELVCAVRPRRVGLSATLGDTGMAQRWLNPSQPDAVRVLQAEGSGPGIKLQIRGYEELPEADGSDALAEEGMPDALSHIADHLFLTLRGSNNLVFAGSRRTVEDVADRLRQRGERDRVPEEFFPHHGSLSKDLRETLELRLKAGELPTTAVATTTLELGIDLGSVRSVAQIGAPRSLAGLKQRLGRSGRRGDPAILRVYVREAHLSADTDPLDRLRLDTVRAVACVRLLQRHWVEPAPAADPALATVALHQTLSIIASQGSIRPAAAYQALFGADCFLQMTGGNYADLLRSAGRKGVDLLEQSPDGLLMLGPAGERLVEDRDFYAVFVSNQEWRLVAGGRTLGTIPIANMLGVGAIVTFAGRRWRVEAVDDRAKVLDVVSHRAGRIPLFDRLSNEPLHDQIVAVMRDVFEDDEVPAYLDPTAREFLAQGRKAYVELGLQSARAIPTGRDTYLLTWKGTAVNSIVAILMTAAGLEAQAQDIGVTVANTTPAELRAILASVTMCPPVEELVGVIGNVRSAKYDELISEDLLIRLWCDRNRYLEYDVTQVLSKIGLETMSIG